MEWTYYHSKLGMGKINPVEKPQQPNGLPATNEPRKERIINNPQAPVTSNVDMTTGQMIEAAKLADGPRTDSAGGPDAVATPDNRVNVTDIGAVYEGTNEETSRADAQVDTPGVGETPTHSVEAEGHESLPTAGPDDSGFNTDKTTDDSGPTKTWDKNYGGGSDVLKQGDPVTSEPWPPSDEGVKKSSEQHLAVGTAQHPHPDHASLGYDSDPFPHKDEGGTGEASASAEQGVQPADPVGQESMKSYERVNVLEPVTSPENNSGPTKQWTGTDGNGVLRQQEPVTGEPWPPASDGVKASGMITSHVVKAMKLADMEIDLGIASQEDKYNRLAELGNEKEEVIDAQLDTLSRVKEAGLKKPISSMKSASRLPSFKLATQAPLASTSQAPIPDEAIFW